MGKTAYLFPGQGAQKAGMGKDFYEHSAAARTFFEEASEQLQMDLKTLCFTDNENLNQTAYTQPAMVTAELAIVEAMKEAGIFCPDAAAGLSLGEYSALAAAGVLAPMDAVRAVKSRGRLMEEAVPAGEGAMSAVLAMKPETVEGILGDLGEVWIANDNCPGQLVISGRTEAVERAEEALRRAGAKRVIRLKVSGPFHSPLLKKAGEALGTVLEPIPAARAGDPVCGQCDRCLCPGKGAGQGTADQAGIGAGKMETEHSYDAGGWRGYVCRDRSGKNPECLC